LTLLAYVGLAFLVDAVISLVVVVLYAREDVRRRNL